MDLETQDLPTQDQKTVKFDEPALRGSGFQPGPGVVLADGQAWQIPCPMFDLIPRFAPDGGVGYESVTTFGQGFDELVDAVQNAETIAEEATSLFRLAIDLLGRNYQLGPDQFRALLVYPGDGNWVQTPLGDIYRVAIGTAPKPTPDGSGSA